jgi:hypothetical protein
MDVTLDEYTFFADAVFLNPAAIAPNAGGVLALFPGGVPIPNPLNIGNVGFGVNSNVSNFAVTGVGFDAVNNNVISVFSTGTTHVILDIFAFVTRSFGDVIAAFTASGGASAATQQRQARADRRKQVQVRS